MSDLDESARKTEELRKSVAANLAARRAGDEAFARAVDKVTNHAYLRELADKAGFLLIDKNAPSITVEYEPLRESDYHWPTDYPTGPAGPYYFGGPQ